MVLSMKNEVLEKFGKAIFNFFLENFEENEEFVLCATSFVFDECCKENDLKKEDVIKNLQDIKINLFRGDYIKIAIATYQVYIAEDISFEKESAYYNKLREAYPNYSNYANDTEIMNNYFKDKQEELWDDVKEKFSKEKRNLIIPPRKTEKGRRGRYVQYPQSQRLLLRSELEEYFKVAEELFSPFEVISFEDFKYKIKNSKIGYKICDLTEKQKDLAFCQIFLYYNYWLENPPDDNTSSQKLTYNEKQNFDITIRESSDTGIEIRDNGEPLTDLSKLKTISIDEVAKYYFIYNKEYSDWELSAKKIDNSITEIFICVLNDSSKYLLLKNYQFSENQYDKYKFIRITDNIMSICSDLGFKIAEKSKIEFIGGIRSNPYQNTWFSFALPIIKVACIYAYVDSKKLNIENGQLDLQILNLEEGWHFIKIPNSTTCHFFISDEVKNYIEYNNIGWTLENANIQIIFSNEKKNADICGFTVRKEINEFSSRDFLQQRKVLENRFSNIQTMALRSGIWI